MAFIALNPQPLLACLKSPWCSSEANESIGVPELVSMTIYLDRRKAGCLFATLVVHLSHYLNSLKGII